MRGRFDEQLDNLNNMLIEMGGLIESALGFAAQALEKQDVELAKKVIALEEEANQKEKDVENLCLKLLLQQQPVARDLRLISAALKMITDMERIGDQSADISEIVIMMSGTPYIKKLEHIPQMAVETAKMVTEAIDAFVKKDLELAQAVVDYDDVVDDLFDKVRIELMELIREGDSIGVQAIDLLMIAKYFERIGDHAVNIAGWVQFSITGKHSNSDKQI